MRCLAITVAVLVTVLAFPAAAAPPSLIFMRGGMDCGAWATARASYHSLAYEAFSVGFLNGLAMGHGMDFWNADGAQLSGDAVYLWVDKYCAENPQNQVITGLTQLYATRSGWRPPHQIK